MTDWTEDELQQIGAAVELQITSRRSDATLRPAIPIWHVRVGDAIYVRSMSGPENGWFRRAKAACAGRISSGGVEKDVAYELADPEISAEITAAYHAKYDRFGPGPVGSVTGTDVAETTLRVTPER